MKTLINATGDKVCNAVTEFLRKNEISMDNMISICTDCTPSMVGKRKGFASRLIGHNCVIYREKFLERNIGNRDPIAIHQMVV